MKKLEDIVKYRSAWMGLAIIWVIFFHMGIKVDLPILSFIKKVGYGGVDIFVFCTGVGCYYSLFKNENVLEFYSRRMKRIYPTYWLFLPLWHAFVIYTDEFKPTYLIGNILGLQTFTGNGNEVSWYISAMVLFYAICPLFYFLVKKAGDDYRGICLCFIGTIVFTFAFWASLHMNIMTTRIPLLYLGMLLGRECKRGRALNRRLITALTCCMAVGIITLVVFVKYFEDLLRPWGLWWYPFILIVPGMVVLFSILLNSMQKLKATAWISTLFSKIGEMSFELFLGHILCFGILGKMIEGNKAKDTAWLWMTALFISIVLAVLLKTITKKLYTRRLNEKKHI